MLLPKENPGSTSGYQYVPMSPVLYPLFCSTSANVVSLVGNPDACARKMKTGNRSSEAMPAGSKKRSTINHSSRRNYFISIFSSKISLFHIHVCVFPEYLSLFNSFNC